MEVVWSNNQVSMLIELYQQRNILWDASNKDYKKDKFKKNDAWADIAAELNMSQKEVETKMHILRSQFSREKKKLKSSKRTGSGAEEVIKSRWQWYDPLQFLLRGATTSGTSDTMGTVSTYIFILFAKLIILM
ncbi:hypothetical protein PYW08_006274 [Mythimna loreyi]|uniref:Uncharacterized protein n=1 Tax=Mythimna loreyi TaxID=667449 RepID=A0ACC2QPS4_9NEOP|nr:hypothetical protein PYW08_006274 [Mythimna loreyi]